MFEGTGKYFSLLFLIIFIVYLTVKICLGKLFKEMKIPAWKAYIPFYNRLILIKLLDLKKTVFYKTLIPIYNLYIYKIIIAELLKAYKMDPSKAIWYIILPMYKFPELVFKHPKFMLHMYDETEEFITNQNILYETPKDNYKNEPEPSLIINQETYTQVPNIKEETDTNVFLNNIEKDERQETVIEAKTQKPKPIEKPIVIDKSKPQVCPNCGTKLSPSATTCFLCGTKLL